MFCFSLSVSNFPEEKSWKNCSDCGSIAEKGGDLTLKRKYFSQAVCDTKPPIRLFYYILCDDGCYGAEILMERNGVWGSAAVKGITTSPKKIGVIMQVLQKNKVTPCTLQDIILDMLNKY